MLSGKRGGRTKGSGVRTRGDHVCGEAARDTQGCWHPRGGGRPAEPDPADTLPSDSWPPDREDACLSCGAPRFVGQTNPVALGDQDKVPACDRGSLGRVGRKAGHSLSSTEPRGPSGGRLHGLCLPRSVRSSPPYAPAHGQAGSGQASARVCKGHPAPSALAPGPGTGTQQVLHRD